MTSAKINSKGQITIPAGIHDALQIFRLSIVVPKAADAEKMAAALVVAGASADKSFSMRHDPQGAPSVGIQSTSR